MKNKIHLINDEYLTRSFIARPINGFYSALLVESLMCAPISDNSLLNYIASL